MSSDSFKKLEQHLHYLNMRGERAKAIQAIRQYLSKNRGDDRVLLKLAFFLYHHAIPFLYGNKEAQEKAKIEFKQAILICKKLVKKDILTKEKITLNARIYLAQMYAILKKPVALVWARRTYSLYPSLLTANRLADVYARLGHTKYALRWYRKWHKEKKEFILSKKERIMYYSDLARLLHGVGKEREAFSYACRAHQLLRLLPKTLETISMYKILTSTFPQLKRTNR